ncbi:MAG: D-2-hydroxyacid dehydrogenase [Anaerolineales bacterium]|nr:D-2-hydroxyacid dehydrogenase [Anaerolineales bacterium]
MMHRLAILSDLAEQYRAVIEKENLPDLTIESTPGPDTDILLGNPHLMKNILASLPALSWVQSTSAGVELLMDSSLRRDYVLTNARDVFGRLMSEYIFGYLLAHERQIFQRFADQQAKRWNDENTGVLYGKTIGLLGVGSIGAEVAKTAKFFNMTVRGYTQKSEMSADVDHYFHGNDLLKFANGLDYLVSILPNTKETRKIVNADVLNALPTHALFISVGRGSAVDESALLNALTQNKIAGAVLDVFEKEPLPQDHPFWTTPNLLMTFHTSAPSLPEDIAKLFIENYKLFNQGKPLKFQVDFEKGY